MREEDLIKVGALVLRAVMSIPCNRETKEGFLPRRNVFQRLKTFLLGPYEVRHRYRDRCSRWRTRSRTSHCQWSAPTAVVTD